MTKLLRKTVEWAWTPEQEQAFERIKAILTTKPLLVYPDFRLPFRVVTDASKVGLGACLMQERDGGWKPVAYASKVNSETEGKCGITELECLAVVWAIKLFRPYLYGRKFTILTDHAALKWLMSSPNLTGKLHRWALTLQEFDFDVQYRPGNTNVVADALSRAPVAATVFAAIGRRRLARQRAADRMAASVEGNTSMEAPESGEATQVGSSLNVTTNSGDIPPIAAAVSKPDAGTAQYGYGGDGGADDTAVMTVGGGHQREPHSTELGIGEQNFATTPEMAVTATPAVSTTPRDRLVAEPDAEASQVVALNRQPNQDMATTLCPEDEAKTRARRTRRPAGSTTASRPQTRASKRIAEKEERRRQGAATAAGSECRGSGTKNTTIPASTARAEIEGVRRAADAEGYDAVNGEPHDYEEPRRRSSTQEVAMTTSVANPERRAATITSRRSKDGVDTARLLEQAEQLTGQAGGGVDGDGGRSPQKPRLPAVVTAKGKTPQRPARAEKGSQAKDHAVRRGGDEHGPPAERDGGDRSRKSGQVVEGRGVEPHSEGEQQLDERRPSEPTLQLTDADIVEAQAKSRLVQRLAESGEHQGKKVTKAFGLVLIETLKGRRVVLPPVLWATVFKENHDSIWAGHLRATHTHARIARLYWWPNLEREVRRLVTGCQECGSRKARPREVIPPLRSLKGGDVGHWTWQARCQ
ncbi:hypothetical protein PR002_g12305 [Phytophthora rubi]|uniref:Reverse transcriptase RNase H-like domain-containing protein n=1 Tax=Phytophthora rubi TaxID=129364 RepID=A0A6A3LPV6_9STRA|nr:hypothetical protein PR002_g12305 [Phytophthora rubi]